MPSPETKRARELLKSTEKLLEQTRNRHRYDPNEHAARMPSAVDDFAAFKRWLDEIPSVDEPRQVPQRQAAPAEPVTPSDPYLTGWKAVGEGQWEKSTQAPTSRIIHGLASSSTINSHDYAVVARGMGAVLPVPLLSGHKGHDTPIGEVFYCRKTEKKIYVRAALYHNEAADYAWGLILKGELRAFSGAPQADGLKLQGIVEGKKFYSVWRLGEVSIAKRGANPDSIFEVWNGIDSGVKFLTLDSGETLKAAVLAHRETRALEPASAGPTAEEEDFALRSIPTMPYKGAWNETETYSTGEVVLQGGRFWHCNRDDTTVPPNSPAKDGVRPWTKVRVLAVAPGLP